jgi:GT2 family glycosyltransferase
VLRDASGGGKVRTSILVLCYGDHYNLAVRVLSSLMKLGVREDIEIIIGLNDVCDQTRALAKEIGKVVESKANVGKYEMMRRMLAQVTGELVWWFDDDSYIVDGSALERRLMAIRRAPEHQVLWGHTHFFHGTKEFDYGEDVVEFVRSAAWYKGRPIPCGVVRPGDHGEGACDRWFFATGGCWIAMTEALRILRWPDVRMTARNDDVLLCEAIRQQGWSFADIGPAGCVINDAPRRGGW